MQNYPNLFSARGGSASGGNSSTKIAFSIPVGTGHAPSLLKVYDVEGRYEVTFDASGVYFYRLLVERDDIPLYRQTKKLVLVR